ncbi:hypothetical protein Tco_0484391 [Tanacetum coccineum]
MVSRVTSKGEYLEKVRTFTLEQYAAIGRDLPIDLDGLIEASVTEPSTATEDLASEDYHVGGSRGATFNLGFVVNNTKTAYKSGGGPEEMVGKFNIGYAVYDSSCIWLWNDRENGRESQERLLGEEPERAGVVRCCGKPRNFHNIVYGICTI